MTPITNEVSSAIPTLAVADRAAVSAPALVPPGGKPLAAASKTAVDPAALDQAVHALNDRYAQLRTDLKFTVDESSGRTVVAVVDATDGTVLRQMPSEEALRIAHALSEPRGALIQRTA